MRGPNRKSELQALFQSQFAREQKTKTQEGSGSLNSAVESSHASRRAVVGLIVRYDVESEGRLEFLLTLRSDTLKTHAQEVALPGGILEGDETLNPLAALDREVQEEVGIEQGCVEWEPLPWAELQSLHGIWVRAHLGYLRRDRCPSPLSIEPAEVAEYAWLRFEDLFDSTLWEKVERSRVPWRWLGWKHPTWGLTAAFLRLFVRRISGSIVP